MTPLWPRLSVGVFCTLLAAILLVAAIAVGVPSVAPAVAGPLPEAGGATICIVVRDDSSRSHWASPGTLALTSAPSPLPDSTWFFVERSGVTDFLMAWRPIVGDSIELARHHRTRLRFSRTQVGEGTEWWPATEPLILYLLLPRPGPVARPKIGIVSCPAGNRNAAS